MPGTLDDDWRFAELARELTETYARLREDAPEDWRTAEPEVLHDAAQPRGGASLSDGAGRAAVAEIRPLWVAEAQRLRDRLGAFQDLSVLHGFTAPHRPLAPWRARLRR